MGRHVELEAQSFLHGVAYLGGVMCELRKQPLARQRGDRLQLAVRGCDCDRVVGGDAYDAFRGDHEDVAFANMRVVEAGIVGEQARAEVVDAVHDRSFRFGCGRRQRVMSRSAGPPESSPAAGR